MRTPAKSVSACALMCSLVMILSYIEAIVPIYAFIPIPGFKLGLANIVVLYAMRRNKMQAALVMATKVLLSFLLFGGVTSFIFSLFGGILSYISMFLSLSFANRYISYIGHSVIGAFAHNSGQLIAAIMVMGSGAVISYYPFLTVSAVISGSICGFILNTIEWRLNNEKN